MFLGEYIKKYRKAHSLTMDEFALKANLSKGYISMLEKNRHPQNNKRIAPSLQTIQKIADATNTDVEDLLKLMSGLQPITLNKKTTEEPANLIPMQSVETVQIPVYGRVPAGPSIEAVEYIEEMIDIPAEWTKCGQEYMGLIVSGDSMFPKYQDGDIVVVKLQPDCESGQDCVVYVNGYDSTLKKVIKEPDGIMLQPLNPEYSPKKYDYADELNPVTILGIVVELRRKI